MSELDIVPIINENRVKILNGLGNGNQSQHAELSPRIENAKNSPGAVHMPANYNNLRVSIDDQKNVLNTPNVAQYRRPSHRASTIVL